MMKGQWTKDLSLSLYTTLSILAAGAWAQNDLWRDAQPISRSLPAIAADHPGNIFAAGEPVTIKVPRDLPGQSVRWQAVDDGGAAVAQGEVVRGESVSERPAPTL